jgi:hypothetical protein
MRADVAEAEAETKLRAAERDVCTEALAAFRLDLAESNERVLARAEAFDQWADQLERLTEADRQRLAASYARNVERERAENAELRGADLRHGAGRGVSRDGEGGGRWLRPVSD